MKGILNVEQSSEHAIGRGMNVNWTKCQDNKWCPLLTLNLDNPHFTHLSGVYVIWHGGPNPSTVYVGKGHIAERIRSHRDCDDILKFSYLGLFVTWAQVPPAQQDGVERYLADYLKPKVGDIHPHATPIPVNFPW